MSKVATSVRVRSECVDLREEAQLFFGLGFGTLIPTTHLAQPMGFRKVPSGSHGWDTHS